MSIKFVVIASNKFHCINGTFFEVPQTRELTSKPFDTRKLAEDCQTDWVLAVKASGWKFRIEEQSIPDATPNP